MSKGSFIGVVCLIKSYYFPLGKQTNHLPSFIEDKYRLGEDRIALDDDPPCSNVSLVVLENGVIFPNISPLYISSEKHIFTIVIFLYNRIKLIID